MVIHGATQCIGVKAYTGTGCYKIQEKGKDQNENTKITKHIGKPLKTRKYGYYYWDIYMLDEGREVHDLLEDHPVDHLDVVVPHQARGAGGGEAGVGHLASHAGVHHTGYTGCYTGWG